MFNYLLKIFNKNKLKFLSILILLIILLVNLTTIAQNKKLLSKIIVAMDHNYPPYIFRGDDGILKGYLVDLWKEWEKVTGTLVVPYATEWSKALDAIKNGEADIIDTIFFTEERAKIFNYSETYAKIIVPIFVHKSISGIVDYDSLKGFLIGAKEGDATVEFLQKNGITNLILFKDYKDIILAAKENKIKIFTIDEPCANYYLNKFEIIYNYKVGFNLYTGELHRAVRKGDEAILDYVEKGFKNIPKREYKRLNEKWFGKEFKKSIPIKNLIIMFSVLFFIIAFFIINIYILSRLVKKRTKELQLAYEKIEQEKNLLQALFKVFPDIIIVLDKNFYEIHTFSPENLIENEVVIKEYLLNKLKKEWINNEIFTKNNYYALESGINLADVTISFDIRIIKTKNDLLLILARDITEKKEIEKRIFEKQKLEVIGTLASGLSHDINNVLHSTLSISSLIKMMVQDNDISMQSLLEYADILEKSALKGTSLVSSLNNFSRDSSGLKEKFNLINTINNSISIFEMKYKKKISVSFNSEIDDAIFEGNENQIMQVILNLLINSLESIEKKDKQNDKYLSVFLSKNENYYQIRIEDNGIGIDSKIAEKVFDPFFTTKGQGRGVGVGLTIAKKVVEDHHGKIEFESNIDGKTIFTILLPINKEYELKNSKESINFDLPINDYPNINILLVDDDLNVLELTKKNLMMKRFNVIASSDPIYAKDLFLNYKDKISLCILDLVMPELNGIELLKYFISEGYKGKTIICTGYRDDPRLYSYKELNIIQIIEKPFQMNYLLEIIDNAIKGS